MTARTRTTLLFAAAIAAFAGGMSRSIAAAPATRPAPDPARVARGKYLVHAMGCNDCHTPWKVGPNGPEMDMSRELSGHPADLVMPPPQPPSGPWAMHVAGTMTAWAGPWGVSFTANLTPDAETGLGNWTEEMFLATMKTGRHQGKGRALLPPMPYFNVGGLTDEDAKAVFAYLQSIKPIKNRVPAPIDPPDGTK